MVQPVGRLRLDIVLKVSTQHEEILAPGGKTTIINTFFLSILHPQVLISFLGGEIR